MGFYSENDPGISVFYSIDNNIVWRQSGELPYPSISYRNDGYSPHVSRDIDPASDGATYYNNRYGISNYDSSTGTSKEFKVTPKITEIGASTYNDAGFGNMVAIGDNKMVIGQLYSGSSNGSVYVYGLGHENRVNAWDGESDGHHEQLIIEGPAKPVGSYKSGFGGVDRYNTGNFYATQDSDAFKSIAVGCGRIVVGASGVTSTGKAYIYDYSGNLINTVSGIQTNAASLPERLGTSVAVGCNRIVVAAKNGFSGYDTGAPTSKGNIYIYDLNGNRIKRVTVADVANQINWERDSLNKQANGAYFFTQVSDKGKFGHSIAVGNNRIVVGYPFGNTGTINHQYGDYGAVAILDLNGNALKVLEPRREWHADPTTTSDQQDYQPMFGYDVAIGHGLIAVSMPGDQDTPYRDTLSDGKVFVFDLSGKLLYTLYSQDFTTDEVQFGYQIAIADGRIYVSSADPASGGSSSTLKYVYVFNTRGKFIEKITPSDYQDGDGAQVIAAGCGFLAVGAPRDNADATRDGSVYVYETLKQDATIDLLDKTFFL